MDLRPFRTNPSGFIAQIMATACLLWALGCTAHHDFPMGAPSMEVDGADGHVDGSMDAASSVEFDDVGGRMSQDSAASSVDSGVDTADQFMATPDQFIGTDAASGGELLYPASQIHSPITQPVIEKINELYGLDDRWMDDVFMKVGASSTVSRHAFHCFDGDDYDLGENEHLRRTLDYFRAGQAGDVSPFARNTRAAQVGRGAGWAIQGQPSPIEQEITDIQPRLAFVHYGTNDMNFGATFASALRAFHDNLSELLDTLIERGIVPIVMGISHRLDAPDADRWVPTFNLVIRGLAQTRSLPFVDLHLALESLDNFGMSDDGVHLNVDPQGGCQLTEASLEYGYNMRNLIALESLDRVQAIADGAFVETNSAWRLGGEGTYESPYTIVHTPFVHHSDTARRGQSRIDLYSCGDADESGPEIVYAFEVSAPSRVNVLVFDRGEVDIDVHLLGIDGRAEDCLERGHHGVDVELQPGRYLLVLDSFVNNAGRALSGPYLVAVNACELSNPDCRWE